MSPLPLSRVPGLLINHCYTTAWPYSNILVSYSIFGRILLFGLFLFFGLFVFFWLWLSYVPNVHS